MNNRSLALLMTFVWSLSLQAMEPHARTAQGPALFKAPSCTSLVRNGRYVASAGLYVLSQVQAAEQESRKTSYRELTVAEQCMGYCCVGVMIVGMAGACGSACDSCDKNCDCCPNRHPHGH